MRGTFPDCTLLLLTLTHCTPLSLTRCGCLLRDILRIIVMLSKRALVCLSIRDIFENNCLALVVLCRRHFLISAVEILIDTEQLSDGGLVAGLVHIYLINLLHDVDVQVIDSSLSARSRCGEGTLDYFRLLHVLLCDFVQTDNLLFHNVEFSLQHFYVFLCLFIVLLD